MGNESKTYTGRSLKRLVMPAYRVYYSIRATTAAPHRMYKVFSVVAKNGTKICECARESSAKRIVDALNRHNKQS